MNRTLHLPPRSEQNSVCFTGHRMLLTAELPRIRLRLRSVVHDLYQLGYRWFICGGALGFDTLAAQEVIAAKEIFPDIGLLIAVPCADQSARWEASDQAKYINIRNRADEVVVLSPRYFNGCMHLRNQFMVHHAAVCVCWLYRFSGGTGYTVRYALSCRRKVINLCLPGSEISAQIKEPLWNYTFTFPSVSVNALIVHSIPLPAVLAMKWNNTCLMFSGKHPNVPG